MVSAMSRVETSLRHPGTGRLAAGTEIIAVADEWGVVRAAGIVEDVVKATRAFATTARRLKVSPSGELAESMRRCAPAHWTAQSIKRRRIEAVGPPIDLGYVNQRMSALQKAIHMLAKNSPRIMGEYCQAFTHTRKDEVQLVLP